MFCIWSTSDTRAHHFAWESSASKTTFLLKCPVFHRPFDGAFLVTCLFKCFFCVEQCCCFLNVFDSLIFLPSMAGHQTINTCGVRWLDACISLRHINAIEVVHEAQLLKRRFVFIWELKLLPHDIMHLVSCVLICAGWRKITCLVEQMHLFAIKLSCADGSVMSGCLEVQFWGSQDGIDMNFPQPA